MLTLHVAKKYNIRLTYKPPYTEAEDLLIGQLWEYQEPPKNPQAQPNAPHWFQFTPKYLKDFDYRLIEDGRDNKEELLQSIKAQGSSLVRRGYIPAGSSLAFSLSAVEQCF